MGFTKIEAAGLSTTGSYTIENINITGVITATSFIGDISQATGAAAGLGTALSQDQSNPLNKIYYTDTVLSIGSTQTVNPPDSSNIAYTQYAEIAVEEGYDLIVEDGDDLIPDILGLSTETAGVLAGAGGRVRADNFTNKAGTGAPTFSSGAIVQTGTGTTALIVEGDARVTGILTIGTSSVTLDGTNNQVNVGTGVTIHHTNGVQVGENTVHSTGLTVNQINSTGVITATSFSGDGSNLTGIDSTALVDSGSTTRVQANTSGAVVTGVLTSTTSVKVGNTFIDSSSVGIATVSTATKTGLTTAVGQLVYDFELGKLQLWNGLQWSEVSAVGNNVDLVIATGGTISELPNPVSGTDRLHEFYSTGDSPETGTFTVTYVNPGTTAEVLVVGGGGGAGSQAGGGGGGLYVAPAYPLSTGSYPIVAGARGSVGNDTTAFGLTAGGGGGGTSPGQVGVAGRSAGGNGAGSGGVWGSPGQGGRSPATPISPSGAFTGYGGNIGGAGGAGSNPNGWGGGGGGATADGGNASDYGPGGPGGAGISSSITGVTTYFAVGGAGASGTQATGAMYRNGSGNGGYYGGPQGAGAPGGYPGSPGGVYIRYKWKN